MTRIKRCLSNTLKGGFDSECNFDTVFLVLCHHLKLSAGFRQAGPKQMRLSVPELEKVGQVDQVI